MQPRRTSSARRLAKFVALAAIVAAGCDRLMTVEATPSENFVLAAEETTADLRSGIRRWNEAMRPWLEGGELNAAEADGVQRELPRALAKFQAAKEKLAVPDDPKCDVLLVTLERYVEWEESQFARREELLSDAKGENPGSEATRGRVAAAIVSMEEEAFERRKVFYDVARDIGVDIVE